jgi:hypothetical protein
MSTARARIGILWIGVKKRFRGAALTTVLLAGLLVFLHVMNGHQPVKEWLTFRYMSYVVACAALAISWFSAGHVVVRRCLPSLPLAEHVVVSTAVGLVAFAILMFLIGLAGFRGPFAFVVVPLLLFAAGARSSYRFVRRLRRHWPKRGRVARPFSPVRLVLLALGVVSLALSYFPIILPDNVAYDARWYHMAIAEHYAAQGRIAPFREGWFLGAYPQLASFVYTWAFLAPYPQLFDKIELSAHLEFTLFLGTLLGIQALTRRLLNGRRVELAWVALFAFPGRFVYDSSLSGAADHIAAFWAAPIFLVLLRTWRSLEPKRCVLLGAVVSGALLTKYSAVAIVAFPAIAVAVSSVLALIRRLRHAESGHGWFVGPALALGTVLALTAIHWVKNLAWYGDPAYPLLHGIFASRPWTVDTPDRFGHFTPKEWIAERSWQGVKDTLEVLYQFSFVPHDWFQFHGVVPLFGSLFTLSVPCLFFLQRAHRLWALYAAAHVGVAIWFWTFHQDRYLQACVPWMAAGIAAVAVRIWQYGIAARSALVLLAAAQLAWGVNAPFIPAHSMLGMTPLKPAIDFLATGYQPGRSVERRIGLEHIGRELQGKGRLLLHEEHVHLGVGVPTVSDWIGWQGGVSYGRAPSPDAVYATLKKLRVTRLLWPNGASKGYDSLAGDIAFFNFTRFTSDARAIGGHMLARMPATPPSRDTFHDRALFLGCETSYSNGIYRVSDMTVTVLPTPRPKSDYPAPREPLKDIANIDQVLPTLDAIVVESCATVPENARTSGFTEPVTRANATIWLRSRP